MEQPTLLEWIERLLQRNLAPVEVEQLERFQYVTQPEYRINLDLITDYHDRMIAECFDCIEPPQPQTRRVAIVGVSASVHNAIRGIVNGALSDCIIIDELPQPFSVHAGIDLMIESLGNAVHIKPEQLFCDNWKRERDYPTLREGIRRNQIKSLSKGKR